MKRTITLFAALLFSAGLSAQGLQPGPTPVGGKISEPFSAKQLMLEKNANKAVQSRWYCYALTMDEVLGTADFNWNNLFPDTTILVDYGSSGFSGPWIHSLGNMFDPVSTWFNDPQYYPTDLKVSSYMPYSLDSIAINFLYDRNLGANIVDTLRFQVAVDPIGGTGINFPRGGWLGSQLPHFGADTVWYKRISFTTTNNQLTATPKYTYNVLLNADFFADSLDDGSHIAQFATPQLNNVPADYKVGVFVTFHPGFTWIANTDTLANKNRAVFFSYEENGENTYPNYVKGEYNCSYIGTDDSHFISSSSWFGRTIPTWAYTQPFGYENHLIYYHVTANETGIIENQNYLSLVQNYPNPANNATTIVYSLNKASNVSLNVFDITGKQVLSLNEGIVNAGQHEINIDLSKFNSGVYFYTLQAADQKVSRKMIVNR
jgi:hypothetical protein